MERVDALVVGAGFGGLAAALSLCQRGWDVAICERLSYPGGCASTFERRGWKFESGATLFAGLDSRQLFGRWIDRYELPVEIDVLDPVVELRTDAFRLEIPSDRGEFAERLGTLEGVDPGSSRRFFDRQRRVADALWELFRSPELLPPFGLRQLFTHLRRTPQYLPILPLVGRSFERVLNKYGLDTGWARTYFDAVCQITVQTDAAQAEAPFAIGASDYFFRGAGHVRGGIGELATALADQIRRMGGQVSFADEVRAISREDDAWRVESRRRTWSARGVVANVLPGALRELTDGSVDLQQIGALDEDVRSGWGAAMLYLGIEADADLPNEPTHLELIDDRNRDFVEGNHVFCSVSGSDETDRAPGGQRTVTCSTHVDMGRITGASTEQQAAYVERVQEQMRATIRRRAPEIAASVVEEMTASPRTFERFTGRPGGYVGGVPRRAGLANYRRLTPMEPAPGLYLVGDSVFPGQSTLACAVGGINVARSLADEFDGSNGHGEGPYRDDHAST